MPNAKQGVHACKASITAMSGAAILGESNVVVLVSVLHAANSRPNMIAARGANGHTQSYRALLVYFVHTLCTVLGVRQ